MAHDYAWVHLKFTIPLAFVLTLLAYPILNRIHLVQIFALVIISFTATLPWDAYLIKTHVWTYPPEAILGPRLWGIPYEELFFFIIQTYTTSLVYILVNKPALHVQYLVSQRNPSWTSKAIKLAVSVLLVGATLCGAYLVRQTGRGTYLGLILVWACPFALITWVLAGHFILSMPPALTLVPIVLPTLYLWLVDEAALGRGTWSIESGTKTGFTLFGSLDIEEAVFFLLTNTLIVFGQATFDQFLNIIYAFPHIFPTIPRVPTPLMLVESRMTDSSQYDMDRVHGIREAVVRLQRKSRSFYLASAAFSGRLRIDLVLLYSFCRMADDLVDDARSQEEVHHWTGLLRQYLDLHYGTDPGTSGASDGHGQAQLEALIKHEFPASARSALRLLPTAILPPTPLYGLIEGFQTDAHFSFASTEHKFPIRDEECLKSYARCVAGTVGELCVALIAHHCGPTEPSTLAVLKNAANRMGIALQYVNIARDIEVDAHMGRVYLPTTWLHEEKSSPEAVLQAPRGPVTERLRVKLLHKAFALYTGARPMMRRLPGGARGPMVVAVENYMEIGRILLKTKDWTMQRGKATVCLRRRITTAMKALLEA